MSEDQTPAFEVKDGKVRMRADAFGIVPAAPAYLLLTEDRLRAIIREEIEAAFRHRPATVPTRDPARR